MLNNLVIALRQNTLLKSLKEKRKSERFQRQLFPKCFVQGTFPKFCRKYNRTFSDEPLSINGLKRFSFKNVKLNRDQLETFLQSQTIYLPIQ